MVNDGRKVYLAALVAARELVTVAVLAGSDPISLLEGHIEFVRESIEEEEIL